MTVATGTTRTTGWVAEGTALLLGGLGGLSDGGLDAATALPGWTRRHLLAHVASNAEAIGRLVSWARTGRETPMYASSAQRAADIEAGARRPAADLCAWVRRSADELAEAFSALPEPAWQAQVVTAQGRTVPAAELPWMRAREVCVHAVDLGTGIGFADLPDGFCAALVEDIAARRSTAGDGPALTVAATGSDATWTIDGAGEPRSVALPVAELAAWLAGRPARAGLPELPPWL
ncbi:maleylpyruvate isomerase family mycothiol-dependent enzyme [Pseudonocardia asaccharolytica]|uniref:Maleylpyruvate isomerase n=1 Tax=Pseudonocardia asaccharolytica DSM 44247 = NBRC 16224 TaxID=1123024 RepID=A0A511D7B4_9PSEU|nr:maleylpyruvate isomerase family mycothiol-dependent enzyme [Pseudonocardia asaccharolytica]GEL20689.1 maleylpyruvate isomerase [Pseudonocardia asaccharolytica DSM 44247 = NBRC 16224]